MLGSVWRKEKVDRRVRVGKKEGMLCDRKPADVLKDRGFAEDVGNLLGSVEGRPYRMIYL